MFVVLLCHRRSRGVGAEAFHAHWRGERARLVADLEDRLGHTGYVQLHQLSRWNILYLSIRLSRSWPVTAFLSALRGLPLPPLFRGRGARRGEMWDVVELLWYPAREALLDALNAPEGTAAASRLAEDAERWASRTAAVTSEEFAVSGDPALSFPRIVALYCLRTVRSMTRQQMLDYWGSDHKDLVVSLQPALGFRQYDQFHVRSAPELASVAKAFGADGGEEYDAVASLAYGGQGELVRGLFSPATQFANLKLVKDEVGFIDSTRSVLVFGRYEKPGS